MKVILIKNDKLIKLSLPITNNGSFWLNDNDNGHEKNIVCIESKNNRWVLISNDEYSAIENNKLVPELTLDEYHFYYIKAKKQNQIFLIYVEPSQENTLSLYQYKDLHEITIGKDQENVIVYNSTWVDKTSFIIKNENGKLLISNCNCKMGVYINNIRLNQEQFLNPGDQIFFLGLKMVYVIIDNEKYFLINNFNSIISIKMELCEKKLDQETVNDDEEDKQISIYNDEDYFHKKPRFIQKIEKLELQIDPPPAKIENNESSLILTVGPMLTMSMSSLVMGFSAISSVFNNNASWGSVMPSLIVCLGMFSSIFIWPIIIKRYEKKKKQQQEASRQEKYRLYIEEKKKVIFEAIGKQQGILLNSFPKTSESIQVIINKQTRLWERKIDDDDFLTINIGEGQRKLEMNIKYPEEHFTMTEDNLKKMIATLSSIPTIINNVPITVSLRDTRLLSIISNNSLNLILAKQLIVQIIAYHSYEDLKIVMFTDESNAYNWNFIKTLPHSWNDDKTFRYFGTNTEEYKEICYQLERVYNRVKEGNNQVIAERYLILCDDISRIRNFSFIKNIIEDKNDTGFSLIILDNKITNVPTRCESIIEIANNKCLYYETLINNNPIEFTNDFSLSIDYDYCSRILANIPIMIENNKNGSLPNKLSFLEMYNVGKVDQLNIENRWAKSNPILSLSAPVGYGKSSEIISLDLHEKYHGPHGLIAGMTGSGKSEFIITYILSMAINYHPDEVQFILIDYKGGGLTGALFNDSVKLPHIVGTITNLDKNEIKRSFSSIESELKRRQRLFNEARDISQESTIDIYKYQKLYRDKIVQTPVSHLFIITDEFAELKNQHPEFMEQLISIARIGRSLGVHLILATQKPSGIVDPQIWSNTRFRVCLRVQEKSDSNEVLKTPDAAYIKETGRFFFQVGFNEIYALGQAAWAGEKYFPSEYRKKNIDTSINFINNIGYTIKNIETKTATPSISSGEELNNILQHISDIVKKQKIVPKNLWLQRIPAFITIKDLINEFNYRKVENKLVLIVGKYDNPSEQEQKLLTLSLEDGNSLIYGISGSGKGNLLTTLIYSAMLQYTPNEIQFYILDFGSETLKMFKDSPVVGDVLDAYDEDKIQNLYKMLNSIIENRKKVLSNYNGDFYNYLKNSNEKLPAIVIMINNFERYQETYPDYEEELIILSRDGNKYGINFIISTVTPSGMRFKLKQNFNQKFVLEQNNDEDYSTILGNVDKNYPSKIFGRGIIKTDKIYEFQTAFVTKEEEISKYIKDFSKYLQAQYSLKASKVPVLPEIVTKEDVEVNDSTISIGLSKATLETITYNFEENFLNLIISNDISTINKFIIPFIEQLAFKSTYNVILINACDLELNDFNSKIKYFNQNFDQIFNILEKYSYDNFELYRKNNYSKSIFQGLQKTLVIVVGIERLINKLNDENKNKFEKIFDYVKDLNIINYIIIDSLDKIKKIEFEKWFKENTDLSDGIWLGEGFNDQFTLKATQKTNDLKQELDDNFAVVVKRGKTVVVKYIEKFI